METGAGEGRASWAAGVLALRLDVLLADAGRREGPLHGEVLGHVFLAGLMMMMIMMLLVLCIAKI